VAKKETVFSPAANDCLKMLCNAKSQRKAEKSS